MSGIRAETPLAAIRHFTDRVGVTTRVMLGRLPMDRHVDPIDVGLPEDELRSLAVDIEDLVDWAASAGPSRTRLREAAPLEYIAAFGVTALLVSALALLFARRRGSR